MVPYVLCKLSFVFNSFLCFRSNFTNTGNVIPVNFAATVKTKHNANCSCIIGSNGRNTAFHPFFKWSCKKLTGRTCAVIISRSVCSFFHKLNFNTTAYVGIQIKQFFNVKPAGNGIVFTGDSARDSLQNNSSCIFGSKLH